MTSYFLRRLLLVPVTFLLITFMVYTILRFVPGGPIEQAEAQIMLGGMSEGGAGASAGGEESLQLPVDELKRLQEYYALDRPVLIGYLQWLGAWPRPISESVPPVPEEGHEEVHERLQTLANARQGARKALDAEIEGTDLVLHDGRLWTPVPEEEVDPEVRKRTGEIAARTLGERFPLRDYLRPKDLGWADGTFLRPADPGAAATAALAKWREARDALAKAEEETGYVIREDGKLLQRPFSFLIELKSREQEAEQRLAKHLGQRDLIAFEGRIWRPTTEEERKEKADFFREMDSLVAKGYGKRDDLLEELAEKGFTYSGGRYYRPVSEETKAASPDFFETAEALAAARRAAASKLAEIREEDGFVVTSDLRIEKVETRFSGILQLDFGRSYKYTEPVLGLIGSRMGISITFGLTGYLLTWIVCIPLGVMKAIKHRTNFDTASSVVVFLGYSIPGFVLSIILLSTLAVHVDWIPLGGWKPPNLDEMGWFESVWGRIRYMLIPVAGYMVAGFATMTILMKNSLLDNLSQDYVRTAFAKGLTEKRVIFVHALRNSLIPITAGIGQALGLLFAGSFLIEKACNIPGMGLLGYNAILSKDYPIILGLLVFLVLIRLTGNILSDIIWALIDPRIRFG